MAWRIPTLWRLSAGEMRRRPGRSALTLLGIVIGVAAAVSISITIQTTRQAHGNMFEDLTGRASLEVVAAGFGGFDEGIVHLIEGIPGIQTAVPVIQMPAALLGQSGAVPVMCLGIDPARDAAARDYRHRAGNMIVTSDSIMLTEEFAKANGLHLNQSARLLTPTGIVSLPIVGLLEPHGATTFNGGAVAFMPLTTAQRVFGLPKQLTAIQLVTDQGITPEQVSAAIEDRAPTQLIVQTPAARGDLGRDSMAATEQGLASLGVSSLVAGAFVILNTFLMNLGERRKQLAILRAIGATRRQVTVLLLREALVLGVVGTLLGIPIGLGIAFFQRMVLARLLAVTLPGFRWTAEPMVVALLLGPGMALAATFFPARRAGSRSPLEDLMQKGGGPTDPHRRWPAFLGLAILASVVLFAVGIMWNLLPSELVFHLQAPALGAFLVGCVLVVPLFQGPMQWLAARVLTPFLGAEAGLALKQLERHRTRTALTAGVLMVAIVFAIGFGQSLMNNMRHLDDWFARIVKADFFIRGTWPDPAMSVTTAVIPETLIPTFATLPGVASADAVNFIPAQIGEGPGVVIAYTFEPGRPLALALEHGNPADVANGLKRGGVVAGTAIARALGVNVGGEIPITTRQGVVKFRIVGTASEYTGGGMAVYMDRNVATQLFDLKGVHVILLTAKQGELDQLAAHLRPLIETNGLMLQSNADVHQTLGKQLRGFLGFLWILLSLVFVVASLGVVNTLTMNVLEQTRELGLLRAIGMKRRQLAKLIISQALALGIISLIPGIIAGIALAFLINLVTYPLIGQYVPFHLNAWHIVGCFFVAIVIAVLAAVVPARRAARLQIVDALQYE